jgi:hypothetical protein
VKFKIYSELLQISLTLRTRFPNFLHWEGNIIVVFVIEESIYIIFTNFVVYMLPGTLPSNQD